MSIINIDDRLYYERELTNNYAVSFSKRLFKKMLDMLFAHSDKTELDHPDGSVTEPKLAGGCVTESKLAEGAVTAGKIADYSVTADKLSDELMETIDIALDSADDANLAVSSLIETAEGITKMAQLAKTTAEGAVTKADTAQAAVDCLMAYSTNPQRVGTWHNGTPIWRMVIHHQFTYDELDEIQLLNGEYSINSLLPVADENQVALINEYILQSAGELCIVDDKKCTYSSGGAWILFDISKAVNRELDYINGWVEFATPEYNLTTTAEIEAEGVN